MHQGSALIVTFLNRFLKKLVSLLVLRKILTKRKKNRKS